eukprot:CAMPEP_0118945528 /NCGR_PEP_ID=MMETSP1169-20130426/42448_1 /TAXON_ID=36882 /ORGANISM="Pyramimonas obovata, Strain CCMP722" /LENGTH=67 /DNA_ID=CAMNT_0006891267 /DNA_START=285 /DNA_END=488 /DNA_ORIENTATION=-
MTSTFWLSKKWRCLLRCALQASSSETKRTMAWRSTSSSCFKARFFMVGLSLPGVASLYLAGLELTSV